MGKYRSLTCAEYFKEWYSTRARGTDQDALVRVSEEDLHWADIIVCMEQSHRSKIRRKWKGYSQKIRVWNIEEKKAVKVFVPVPLKLAAK